MKLEDVLTQAFDKGDRDSLTQATNLTRIELLHALQSRNWNKLFEIEQDINDSIVAYRSIIRSDKPDKSFVVGQLYALQGMARAYRDSRAAPDDIVAAKRSPQGLMLLMKLHEHRYLMASTLKDMLKVNDDSRLSQLGSQLEQAGLVRKDRVGRQMSYRLTAAGEKVARELATQDAQSAQTSNMVSPFLQNELAEYRLGWINSGMQSVQKLLANRPDQASGGLIAANDANTQLDRMKTIGSPNWLNDTNKSHNKGAYENAA